MELTKRLIEKYLKSSKKEKSEIISKYCELTKVKRATAVKRFESIRIGICFKEETLKRIQKREEGQRRSMNLFMK